MVCLIEWLILYIYRHEYIMNPKANRYDANALLFRYVFLCLLFSKIEGRISGCLNLVGHGLRYIVSVYYRAHSYEERMYVPSERFVETISLYSVNYTNYLDGLAEEYQKPLFIVFFLFFCMRLHNSISKLHTNFQVKTQFSGLSAAGFYACHRF